MLARVLGGDGGTEASILSLDIAVALRKLVSRYRYSLDAKLQFQRFGGGRTMVMQIATQMADAFSSTAQDLNRGRPTEIDALNGYVARRGAELGVPVPVNHALFTLVKLAEQKRAI